MPLEGTLEEDMRRRDLTINALAEDRDGNLLGHPDALSDSAGRHPAARFADEFPG